MANCLIQDIPAIPEFVLYIIPGSAGGPLSEIIIAKEKDKQEKEILGTKNIAYHSHNRGRDKPYY